MRTYIDRALSAKTDNRPDFQRMVKDSAKGLFDVVIVWKLDRFARNRYDSAHYKAQLRKYGVKVLSATENISEGPEGIILESMLEGMAEYYSAELSEKIQRGQKENALKGRNNGGGIPLGYLLGNEQKLVLDPVTAPIVREIFQRYADGEIVRTIVEDFNRRGLKTKNGKPFSPNSFNRILKNRKYIGEYQYQDVIILGGVPAILSDDLFYRVQARLEKNKRAPATAKADVDYLLTTKLFCGLCERMMIGESGTSHTGDKHYYYKCAGAKRKLGCKKKSAKKDFIERAAVVLTVNRVLKDEEIDRIADGILTLQASEDTTIPALKKQLADTERGIENMLNAIKETVPRLWSLLSESVNLLFSFFTFFLILLYIIFILLDYESISEGWPHLVPQKYRPFVINVMNDVKDGMNRYFRGQAFVALCVGILFSIGFLIIDFPLAIGLGLFIGALNLVPYLQIIGFIPTIVLAILKAADTGGNFWIIIASALAVFIIVQAIQDGFIVPRVMGKITGLNPAIILLSLSIWGSLMGMLGMIIALPLTTLMLSYYQRFIINREKIHKFEQTDNQQEK